MSGRVEALEPPAPCSDGAARHETAAPGRAAAASVKPGGGERIRTVDLCRAKAALYRAELHPQGCGHANKGLGRAGGEDQAPARSAAVRTTTCTRSPSPTVPSPLNEGLAQVLRPSAT